MDRRVVRPLAGILVSGCICAAGAALWLRAFQRTAAGAADTGTSSNSIESDDPAAFGPVRAAGLHWLHLSSRHGDLPAPGESTEQTGCIVADLDGSGMNGFVL